MKLGDPKLVGEMMRERRLKLGYTQAQMAQATGLSPITIMRLELGRIGYIHEKTAKALEVPARIEKRLVMTPVAVMRGGQEITLPPLTAMLNPPAASPTAPAVTGDTEAGIHETRQPATAPLVRPKRQRKPIAKIMQPRAKAAELAQAGKASTRQRFLRWLSNEFERMAE